MLGLMQAKRMTKAQDAALASNVGAVIQALAYTPGWAEKNFQVCIRCNPEFFHIHVLSHT